MSKPSFQARTAIEFGEEHQTSGTATVRDKRTDSFTQIPVYGAMNPFATDVTMMPLDRAKPTLDPDGFGTGDASHGISGQVYVFGSGIANVPPDWFRIMKACGMSETRIATKALPDSGSLAVSFSGSGSGLSAGVYGYKFATLVKSDGTTEATTTAEAAFESVPSTAVTGTATAGQSCAVSGLPSDGIKRLYRTYAGGSDYYYLGEVADGTTTYTDTTADVNLKKEIVIDAAEQSGTLAAAESSADGSLPSGTYKYKYTSLYDARGAVVTDSTKAVWESSSCTEVSVTTTSDKGIDVSGMPSSGVKRLYRTVDSGSTFYYVQEVASGTTSVNAEDTSDTDLAANDELVEATDRAIYVPVSDYDDFWSLTINTYLDGRKKTAKGVRGNMSFSGDAGQNVPAPFDLRGVYVAGSKTANPATVAAPAAPSQLCDASCVITRKSDGTVQTAFTPKVRSWGCDLGRDAAQRPDANASCDNAGVIEYMIATEPDPHMTFTIEFDEDQDWDEYARNPDTFSLRITVGNETRKHVKFSNDLPWGAKQYVAQLAAAPAPADASGDGIRLTSMDFKLCGVYNSYVRIEHY